MPLDITPAAPADLPGIIALLDASQLPRAGIEDHVASTLVARQDSGVRRTRRARAVRRRPPCSVPSPWRQRCAVRTRAALTVAALDLARRRGVETVYLLTETGGHSFRDSASTPSAAPRWTSRAQDESDRLPVERVGHASPSWLNERPGLGAALLLPLWLMAGARTGCSQEPGARVADGGRLDASGPNAPFGNALGHQRHQVYLLGLRARRPLLRGGAVELYHTVDIFLSLQRGTPDPIRAGVLRQHRSCPRQDRSRVTLRSAGAAHGNGDGAGLVPAGLELRYAPHRGVRVVEGASIGALYFTRALPDPSAARLNFAVAGDFGVRVGRATTRSTCVIGFSTSPTAYGVQPGMNAAHAASRCGDVVKRS